LVAIGGFGVAVATLSVAATAAVVLLAPQPPAVRVSPAAAIAAVRGETPEFERVYAAAPPEGTRATMVEQLVAAELGRPPASVRVVWSDDPRPPRTPGLPPGAPVAGVVLQGKARQGLPPSFVAIENQEGTFKMVEPAALSGALRSTIMALPLPAFSASVLETDGQWLTVRPVRPFLAGWQFNTLISLAVSLLLLAPLAWLFARRLTRPFRALAGALNDSGDAIPVDGPRELREAALAIEAMRSSLAADATERARMLTAIAHDLRTPLTGLRLRIESVPEPQRARMVADVERMEAMIGEVLAFARNAGSRPELVDVRPLIADIVDDMTVENAPVQLLPGGDAQVFVSAPAFRRAIENLLQNAIDYAGGGAIDLRRADGEVILSIEDSGPGIPHADRERLLLPFERGEASRNRETGGAGLGLSIVRDFAAQHRGKLMLREAAGGGTVAELRLPVAMNPG
jgi:signal transduction histidine kinase